MSEERIQKKMNTCRHFNGIMNDFCEAGVEYRRLAGGQKPMLKHTPCLLEVAESEHMVSCPHASYPTREEAEAEIEESERRIRWLMSRIADGVCPHCDSANWSQVGRCVYCNGCGQRLYQGTLPEGKR